MRRLGLFEAVVLGCLAAQVLLTVAVGILTVTAYAVNDPGSHTCGRACLFAIGLLALSLATLRSNLAAARRLEARTRESFARKQRDHPRQRA